MSAEKYLAIHGDLQRVRALEGRLALVTRHAENVAAGLYFLDVDAAQLTTVSYPAGFHDFVVLGKQLFLAGGDDQLLAVVDGKLSVRGPLPASVRALAPIRGDRLAVVAGTQLHVVDPASAKLLQTLDLEDAGTYVAVAPTLDWLAVGMENGSVAIFECEAKEAWTCSTAQPLHEGAVHALLFEPHELRLYSAGADNKLLSSHARGVLEPEDRGRGNVHSEPIADLAGWAHERFFSGSRDGTLKAWPLGVAVKPAGQKDAGPVLGLTLHDLHGKPHLVLRCADNSLRIFSLDDQGKIGERTHVFHGALDSARHELQQPDGQRRETALRSLSQFPDAPSIDLIAAQMERDADPRIRLLAAELLANLRHPHVTAVLENGLKNDNEAVRGVCFQGLRRQLGDANLRPLELALATKHVDLGKFAVQALEVLAATDLLIGALNNRVETAALALFALERLLPADSPQADLHALTAETREIRRLGLVRLYHRRMFDRPEALVPLLARLNDTAEVRALAFLLRVQSSPALADALRHRDADVHRQFSELEATSPEGVASAQEPGPAPAFPTAPLTAEDLAPLLEAAVSRDASSALAGAKGLAALRDPRAFGLLMQFGAHEKPGVKVQVCRALGLLGDARAAQRLAGMLEQAAPIRDAAFTALEAIFAATPLEAARTGLACAHLDVRARGFRLVLENLRRQAPTDGDRSLLLRVLNDDDGNLRREAFKACLTLPNLGSPAETLRFIRQSIHADVRREALTEVMAQATAEWAWALLLEFLHDPDAGLRKEAFEFACKKFKDPELEIRSEALRSKYADVRQLAVASLIAKRTKLAQKLLVRVLNDTEPALRLAGLAALVDADARAELLRALESPHADVRLEAAGALAKHGLSEALDPLLAEVQTPRPRDDVGPWQIRVLSALRGLQELGDSRAFAAVGPLLDSSDKLVAAQASHCLVGLADPSLIASLRPLLSHANADIQRRIALALAIAGDPEIVGVVLSESSRSAFTPAEWLVATGVCQPAGDERLAGVASTRWLLALLLRDWARADALPAGILAAAASPHAEVRLQAVGALRFVGAPVRLAAYLHDAFNLRPRKKPWTVPLETIRAFAEMLAFATGQMLARTLALVPLLDETEQTPWDQAWLGHSKRFASQIAVIKERPQSELAGAGDYESIAFGALLGMLRATNDADLRAPLKLATEMAAQNLKLRSAAQSALVPLLAHRSQEVRFAAFDFLRQHSSDLQTLARQAIDVGHADLGSRGIELLLAELPAERRRAALLELMRGHLGAEAFKLALQQMAKADAARAALAAPQLALQLFACRWLAENYEREAEAPALLRSALESPHREVRLAASDTLTARKDSQAYEPLVRMLRSAPDESNLILAIFALRNLGDGRAPLALLERLRQDRVTCVESLIGAIGDFRRPAVVDALLNWATPLRLHAQAYRAVLTISGYDQWIEDIEDDDADRARDREQFPRHDPILAKLMQHAIGHREQAILYECLPGARWSRSHELEPILSQLAHHREDALRRGAVEAIGWRARKRQSPKEPLIRGLRHADPVTQFIAAEGLAHVQRGEGLAILTSAVEFMPDLDLRQRAVTALGELGDDRAFDLLWKLANEEGHALRCQAIEALGALGHRHPREQVVTLLEKAAVGAEEMRSCGINGLRRLKLPVGWDALFRVIEELKRMPPDYSLIDPLERAIEALTEDVRVSTHETLLRWLRSAGNRMHPPLPERVSFGAVLKAAHGALGVHSLEPDYAWLGSGGEELDLRDTCLTRVGERGEPARLLGLLPTAAPNVWPALAQILLTRNGVASEAVLAALDHPHPRPVRVAAHLLGRSKPVPRDGLSTLLRALAKWLKLWLERRQWMQRHGVEHDADLQEQIACIETLLWTAKKLGAPADRLKPVAEAFPHDPYYRSIRRAVFDLIAHSTPSPVTANVLEQAIYSDDAELRRLAALGLVRQQPRTSSDLADRIVWDHTAFQRFLQTPDVVRGETLRAGLESPHAQGLALAEIVKRRDREGLLAVAENGQLAESARLGALEGLAHLGDESVEVNLLALARNPAESDEIRKTAWRGLYRSRRIGRKAHG